MPAPDILDPCGDAPGAIRPRRDTPHAAAHTARGTTLAALPRRFRPLPGHLTHELDHKQHYDYRSARRHDGVGPLPRTRRPSCSDPVQRNGRLNRSTPLFPSGSPGQKGIGR
jgi:hypothetical protein